MDETVVNEGDKVLCPQCGNEMLRYYDDNTDRLIWYCACCDDKPVL